MSPVRFHTAPTWADLRGLFRLAAPIVVIQVGIMAMGVVDTLMVGRVSAQALAAVALANLYTFIFQAFGFGVLMALDPIVSQALGAGDRQGVARGFQRGLLLSLALTVPTAALMATVEPAFTLAGQPPAVIPDAAGYVYRVMPAIWPLYGFMVLRLVLQAHRRTAPIVATIMAANVLNAVLNYAWIFGHLGFEPLGVLGSAWATMVSRWFMFAALLVLAWPHLAGYLQRPAPNLLDLRPLARMLALGVPIGAQMVLEIGAFGTVALLMGWLGVVQVAAHQVAINLASLTFMVPLGVSSAAAVIVGHAVGRGDAAAVRRSTFAAILVGAGFMSVTAALFLALPEPFARLYTDEAEVIALAAVLLPIAGVFQVFDGLQVVGFGLLRGLGDTRVPMLLNVVGYWIVGLPLSIWLGFGLDLGAPGLWWGLVVALAAVAMALLWRLRQRQRRELARVVIDDHARGGAAEHAEPAAARAASAAPERSLGA